MNAIAAAVSENPRQLSNEELRRRRKVIDFARVSCELEGLYEIDPIYNELCEQYARGEIERYELDAYADRVLEERINAQESK